MITPADLLEKNESICIFKLPNPPTLKNITAILSCVFFIMSPILNQKRDHEKSLDSALLENEADALLANQNAGVQFKINSGNQGVLQ